MSRTPRSCWKTAKPASPKRPLHHGGGRFDAHQPGFGLGLRGRRADDADHFVDIGVGQQQAFDGVLALPGLGQQELRAAADDRQRDGG